MGIAVNHRPIYHSNVARASCRRRVCKVRHSLPVRLVSEELQFSDPVSVVNLTSSRLNSVANLLHSIRHFGYHLLTKPVTETAKNIRRQLHNELPHLSLTAS